MYYKKIIGKYVYLSPIDLNDAEEYLSWKNRQIRYNALQIPESKYDATNYLKELSQNDSYAIVTSSIPNKLVGFCGIASRNPYDQKGDIWLLMNPHIDLDLQISYGKDALDTYLEFCYNMLNLNNVQAKTGTFDTTLNEIYKTYFPFIGKSFLGTFYNGKYFDTNYFSLTKKEYLNHQTISNDITICKDGITLDNKEKTLPNVVIGKNIILAIPNESYLTKKTLKLAITSLNDPEISIPLGQTKNVWDEITTTYLLSGATYLILKDNKVIGYISLLDPDYYNKTADIEYCILNKEYYGQGYATEAITLFKQTIFESNQLNSLIGGVFDFNYASQKVMAKTNFNLFAVRKESYFTNGRFYNMNLNNISKKRIK